MHVCVCVCVRVRERERERERDRWDIQNCQQKDKNSRGLTHTCVPLGRPLGADESASSSPSPATIVGPGLCGRKDRGGERKDGRRGMGRRSTGEEEGEKWRDMGKGGCGELTNARRRSIPLLPFCCSPLHPLPSHFSLPSRFSLSILCRESHWYLGVR
jgi:hypothetical protein